MKMSDIILTLTTKINPHEKFYRGGVDEARCSPTLAQRTDGVSALFLTRHLSTAMSYADTRGKQQRKQGQIANYDLTRPLTLLRISSESIDIIHRWLQDSKNKAAFQAFCQWSGRHNINARVGIDTHDIRNFLDHFGKFLLDHGLDGYELTEEFLRKGTSMSFHSEVVLLSRVPFQNIGDPGATASQKCVSCTVEFGDLVLPELNPDRDKQLANSDDNTAALVLAALFALLILAAIAFAVATRKKKSSTTHNTHPTSAPILVPSQG